MENKVYNQRCFWGYDVKVGIINSHVEIDFISEKRGEKIYIQVAWSMDEQSAIEREFAYLLPIKDNYKKWVITGQSFKGNSFEGIEVFGIRDFLMLEISPEFLTFGRVEANRMNFTEQKRITVSFK